MEFSAVNAVVSKINILAQQNHRLEENDLEIQINVIKKDSHLRTPRNIPAQNQYIFYRRGRIKLKQITHL